MDAYSTLMLAKERMADLEREARRSRLARSARRNTVDLRSTTPEIVPGRQPPDSPPARDLLAGFGAEAHLGLRLGRRR
jgi:hypothetical protein